MLILADPKEVYPFLPAIHLRQLYLLDVVVEKKFIIFFVL